MVSYEDGWIERHSKERVQEHCKIDKMVTGLASYKDKRYAVDNCGVVYDITSSNEKKVLVEVPSKPQSKSLKKFRITVVESQEDFLPVMIVSGDDGLIYSVNLETKEVCALGDNPHYMPLI